MGQKLIKSSVYEIVGTYIFANVAGPWIKRRKDTHRLLGTMFKV